MTRASTYPRGCLATIICALLSAALAPSAFSGELRFAGAPLRAGGTIRVSVPLSDVQKSYVAEGGNSVPPYTIATLAVPRGFDPSRTWPILVVFSSSERQLPSWYDLMVHYRAPALAEGWLLLSGDGPQPASRVDSSGWRAGHTLAALEALNRSFPASKNWPIACAGQSGGAKRASYLAPLFAAAGYRVAGVFLEGINEERMTEGYRRFQPGRSFLRTPIFLSSGERDTIATLPQQIAVKDAMQRAGFANVRHHTFPGGHVVLKAHVQEALGWFRRGSPQ